MAARTEAFAAVLMIALIAACSDSTSPAPVGPKPVASVLVTPQSPSLIVGGEITFQAQISATDGEILDREVTWTSEDEAMATVSSTGVVSALAVGHVGIRATSEGKWGRTLLTILPVPPAPVAEVRTNVDALELEWNGSAQLSATALDADGNVLEGRLIGWATNKPGVVTVTNEGAVQAVSSGTATLTAFSEGITRQVGVRVKTAPVTEILLDVGTTGLEVGETIFFGARLKTANGQILVGPVEWTSSAPAVAKVTAGDLSVGVVEVLSPGDVTFTASAEGKSASVSLRVTPMPTHDLIYNRWTGTHASEIFTLNLGVAGSAPVRLNAGTVSRDPSPSPDGTQFVFAVSQTDALGKQQHDLFIVNRDGTNMRWLTRVEGLEDQPQWSPDGTKILYHGTDGDQFNPDLFVINVNGTGLLNLTAGLPSDITDKRDPAWSPDGKKIAFKAARAGEHKIWTMNADGSNAARLTTDIGFDVSPTWSPDGSKIAFSRYNSANPAYGWDIMIVSSGSGTPTRLELFGNQHLPAWSPDGHYIAVSGTDGTVSAPENIYTVRPDGTGLRLRTLNPDWGGGVAPAWITRP